jgi:hypothetical protein
MARLSNVRHLALRTNAHATGDYAGSSNMSPIRADTRRAETSVGNQSVELDIALDFRLARELRRQCM